MSAHYSGHDEDGLRTYPKIRSAWTAQQIFLCAGQFDAGILDVF